MRRFLLLLISLPTFAAEKIQFNRDVRPILSDKCFHCHGADPSHRKGELRLDIQAEAMKPAASGEVALVPGSPEKSQMLMRVNLAHEDDDVMPPEKSGKPLTQAEKDLLRQWIAEGAEYQGHWAFIPPVRREPSGAANVGNPIDAFISARLAKNTLQMAALADPATQMRRVALDLTGLPPKSSDLSDVRDWSDKKYEAYVDRLLASQHFGERMAMQWLDFARYADSHGFQTDSSRNMWPWRDWVIRAFNENKRFDHFTIEQIAGDLLPNATQEQKLATGFNRNHRINGEGGIIAEEWRIENIIDRVDTTGSTWMALTLGCCRCHDHKYDPITQKEFYQMFAFFDSVDERGTITGASNRSGGNEDPFVSVMDETQRAEHARLTSALTAAQEKVKVAEKELPRLLAEWEPTATKTLSRTSVMWTPLQQPAVVSDVPTTTFKSQEDGTWLVGGKSGPRETYSITTKMPQAVSLSALLLDCLPDDSLPGKSLGRAFNGNFVLTKIEADVKATAQSKAVPLTFAKAQASYSQKGWDIANTVGKDVYKGWAVDGPSNRSPKKAMFLLKAPVEVPAGALLTIRLVHTAMDSHTIGRFKLAYSTHATTQVKLEGSSALMDAAAILKTAPDKRTAKQKADLARYFRSSVPSALKTADAALATAKQKLEAFQGSLPTSMVMREKNTNVDAFILRRGEYDQPGEKVTAAIPAVLGKLPVRAGTEADRLALARWIASAENPLTARVWVNRTWEMLFGVGLVKTSENFGSQAEYPVHPELLDWLATEFMRTGWDMKAMLKLMVMSQSYRQSSQFTDASGRIDPENRLLARGPRFRLSGEMIRDQALSIAGLLVPKIGGPSVKPYMPEGVWDETSKYGNLRGYKSDEGDGLYRRSFYTIWKRTAAPPTMLLFDAPTREICTMKRSRTNTPLQALSLLNEITFVEAARGLAQQMMKNGGNTPETRIAYGYLRATAHPIEPDALQKLVSGYKARLARFKAKPTEAQALIRQGKLKADEKLDPAELAAFTTTASVLLNLDRVITRD